MTRHTHKHSHPHTHTHLLLNTVTTRSRKFKIIALMSAGSIASIVTGETMCSPSLPFGEI